jgi:uncharacterized membrane protein YkvA (DUF1232 family)
MIRLGSWLLRKLFWGRRLGQIKREIAVYRLLLKDKRTPRVSKILLALAVGYLIMPFDLIPDFIPGLGQLDDVIIIPSLIFVALRLTPRDLIAECRATAGKKESLR